MKVTIENESITPIQRDSFAVRMQTADFKWSGNIFDIPTRILYSHPNPNPISFQLCLCLSSSLY